MFRKRKSWTNKPKNYLQTLEQPVDEFFSGPVALQVWKRSYKRRKQYYHITISRWRTNGLDFWLCEQLELTDMENLKKVIGKFQASQSKK